MTIYTQKSNRIKAVIYNGENETDIVDLIEDDSISVENGEDVKQLFIYAGKKVPLRVRIGDAVYIANKKGDIAVMSSESLFEHYFHGEYKTTFVGEHSLAELRNELEEPKEEETEAVEELFKPPLSLLESVILALENFDAEKEILHLFHIEPDKMPEHLRVLNIPQITATFNTLDKGKYLIAVFDKDSKLTDYPKTSYMVEKE